MLPAGRLRLPPHSSASCFSRLRFCPHCLLSPCPCPAGKKRGREDAYLAEDLDAWESFVGAGKGQARICRCDISLLRRAALECCCRACTWCLLALRPPTPPHLAAAGFRRRCVRCRCGPSFWIPRSTTLLPPTWRTAYPRSRRQRRPAPSPACLAAGAPSDAAAQTLCWLLRRQSGAHPCTCRKNSQAHGSAVAQHATVAGRATQAWRPCCLPSPRKVRPARSVLACL